MSRRVDASSGGVSAFSFVSENFERLDITQDRPTDSDQDALTSLKRWLSIRSIVSTSSSEAIKHQKAAEDRVGFQEFRSIGKGLCGEVFECAGTGRVFKKEHQKDGKLWNDYLCHTLVYKELMRKQEDIVEILHQDLTLSPIHVPNIFEFIDSSAECQTWWDKHGREWNKIARREHCHILATEQIWSLPKVVGMALIQIYGGNGDVIKNKILSAPENQNCLMRIYLGVRRTAMRRNDPQLSLSNFEADLTIIDQLDLEKEHFAIEMARALATMHWACRIDADDVEIVLGSAPTDLKLTAAEIRSLPPYTPTASALNFKRRAVHIWLLDFNNCSSITMDSVGIKKAHDAYWRNDPYFPRPVLNKDSETYHADHELWMVFLKAYLGFSKQYTSEESAHLPVEFVSMIYATATQRFERGENSSVAPPFRTTSTSTSPSPCRNTVDKIQRQESPEKVR